MHCTARDEALSTEMASYKQVGLPPDHLQADAPRRFKVD